MTVLRELKTVAARCQSTLLQDLIGGAALCVLLITALHLPQLL